MREQCRCRRVYTDDERVAAKVADVTSVYVMFIFLGGSTQCLRGVLSGCGRQSSNAKVSLISSYVQFCHTPMSGTTSFLFQSHTRFYGGSYCVGLPISYMFCFQLDWGLAGLWLGLVVSNVFRTLALGRLVFGQDWDELSRVAQAKAAEKAVDKAESKPLASSTGSDSSDEEEETKKVAP